LAGSPGDAPSAPTIRSINTNLRSPIGPASPTGSRAPGSTSSRRNCGAAPGLLECPNAALAPHIGSASRETRTRMATMAVENCLAVLAGGRPANPEGLGAR